MSNPGHKDEDMIEAIALVSEHGSIAVRLDQPKDRIKRKDVA